jgi:hypothetical protein
MAEIVCVIHGIYHSSLFALLVSGAAPLLQHTAPCQVAITSASS